MGLKIVGFFELIDSQLIDYTIQLENGIDKGLKSMLQSNIFIMTTIKVDQSMLINPINFIKNSSKELKYLHERYLEFLLMKHSNIKKLSLINALIHYKELVQTSKKFGLYNLSI